MDDRSEKHPWMKTYTVMSIVFAFPWLPWAVVERRSSLVIACALFFTVVWIAAGIYLLNRTNWYRDWHTWSVNHKRSQLLAFVYMTFGIALTFGLFAIPFAVIGGMNAGSREKVQAR